MTTCADISAFMEEFSPVELAEEWDNPGLLVGSDSMPVRKILLCLDVTSDVIQQAVKEGADMILSHHPLIFKSLKKIRQDELKGKALYQLIQNNIALYSAHTNLDVAPGGVNERLADILGLQQAENLKLYRREKLIKLVVFVPAESLEIVRCAMGDAGAGWIGKYRDCSFAAEGTGAFRPLEGTNPAIGSIGTYEQVREYRLETILPRNLVTSVLKAVRTVHPYEEVAYDLYELHSPSQEYGLGKRGNLSREMTFEAFLDHVKNSLQVHHLRVIGQPAGTVKKAAVFCGAFDEDYRIFDGSFDVLVTGEMKYHTAVELKELGACIVEAGHFATERIILPVLQEKLNKRFPELHITCNNVETDPFKIT